MLGEKKSIAQSCSILKYCLLNVSYIKFFFMGGSINKITKCYKMANYGQISKFKVSIEASWLKVSIYYFKFFKKPKFNFKNSHYNFQKLHLPNLIAIFHYLEAKYDYDYQTPSFSLVFRICIKKFSSFRAKLNMSQQFLWFYVFFIFYWGFDIVIYWGPKAPKGMMVTLRPP